MSQLVFKVAKKWIAGLEMEEALRVAEEINGRGVGVIMNYLGEDVAEESIVEMHTKEYFALQHMIAEKRIDGCVSVKPTQFGLSVNEGLARRNVEALIEEASRLKQEVWVDMESSKNTEQTLQIYAALLGSYRNVGVAMQAYLRRSEKDLAGIIERGGRVRLCKGAYRESHEIVYATREEIEVNFVKLMGILFESGIRFAIATHDSKLVDEAKRLSKLHKANFEFEMLKGIREDLKPGLVREGYRVVDYVPYGKEWYHYSMRRIREHPSNFLLLLRSVV